MTYFLHAGAELDVAIALDYYVMHAGASVASWFLSEFERVATLLVENPHFGAPTTKGRRVFLMRVFPYSVVYRSLDSGIVIIVVRHQHRMPGYGGGRR